MITYKEFLSTKKTRAKSSGFKADVPDFLYPFQRHIVKWALERGRAAIFADCGLGKTPMQLVWGDCVAAHTGKPVLIVAPLAVSNQTQREGQKFDISVMLCRGQSDMQSGVNITNYEMLHHFEPGGLGGLVLDESSILKNMDGTYRKELTKFAQQIPYRLACTATPAPNDLVEIINHSEFLGHMDGKEVIALFFRLDGNTTHAYKIKGHARRDFWAWLASWAVAVRAPSDLGYDDGMFVLPPLHYVQHIVDGHIEDGWLFPIEAHSMQDRRQARKESIDMRVAMCAELANNSAEPWLMWCGLNAESDALRRAIPDAIEVKGSDANEHKTDAMLGFSEGRYRVLVTKPSIAGFGMNWQHCRHMAFVGLSDSFEQFYQATRRCWRFGQTKEVTAHVVVADTEGAVVQNIERKEQNAAMMMIELVNHMGEHYKRYTGGQEYEGRERIVLPAWIQHEEKAANG